MLRFREYIVEETKKHTLAVFDIDDTLFTSSAMVLVKKSGKVIKNRSPAMFNNYELKSGEEFDFSRFRSSEAFVKSAKPIHNILDRVKTIISKYSSQTKTIFLTARADFDDKKPIIKLFAKHGIDIKKDVYLERAGNVGGGSPEINKKVILQKYITSHPDVKTIMFFDDSIKNINMFMSLKKEHPELTLKPYYIKNGKVQKSS